MASEEGERTTASKARFRQADITRVLKGAQAAGFREPRLIIHPNGTMELVTGGCENQPVGEIELL